MSTRKELVKQLASPETQSASTEPAINTGWSVAGIMGIIAAVVEVFFHKQIPQEVQSLIYGTLTIILPIITAYLIRRKVWSPASVVKVVDESVKTALETATILQSNQVKLLPTESVPTEEETPYSRKDLGILGE